MYENLEANARRFDLEVNKTTIATRRAEISLLAAQWWRLRRLGASEEAIKNHIATATRAREDAEVREKKARI